MAMAYLVQQDTGSFRQIIVSTKKEASGIALQWAREWPGHQIDIFNARTWEWLEGHMVNRSARKQVA